MEDWQVAVLVVIVVVFVVLATLMIVLILKFSRRAQCLHRLKSASSTNGGDRYVENISNIREELWGSEDAFRQLYGHDPRIYPSAHRLYFLDFQGELHWLDFKKKPLSKMTTEAAMQQYLFDTYRPTIGEGNGGVRVPADALALSYVNVGQTLVVMDLNRLIARDAEFAARMRHTAERPLLLTRLEKSGADGAAYTVMSKYGYAFGEPRVRSTAEAVYYSSPLEADEPPPPRVDIDLRKSRANPMSTALAVPPTHRDIAVRSAPSLFPTPITSSVANAPARPDTAGMAPRPVIHPLSTHHITTSFPISVTAASYTVLHANGDRTTLDTANTERIEGARLQWDRRQSLVVPLQSGAMAGCQCVLDPVTGEATLFYRAAGSSQASSSLLPESVVCHRADALYYTVERVNSTQWLPFDQPIYLPAGRWCVRARSMLYRDDSSKTSAKVFTVNVV